MRGRSQLLVGQVLVELQGHLVPVVDAGGLAHALDALQDQLAGQSELSTRHVRGEGPYRLPVFSRVGLICWLLNCENQYSQIIVS